MNYSMIIKESIEYIERNIKEKLTPNLVADNVGYSLYHFCRLFQHSLGLSVMEYIRLRRLSLARVELKKDINIIDLAVDYGFETHSGFTKAFKKEYGISPKQLVKNLKSFNEPNSHAKINPLIQVLIIEKPAFKIAGYGIETNIAGESYTKDVGALWSKFSTEGWECRLYETLNPPRHGEVGICTPSLQNNGKLTYVLGVIVESFNNITAEMIKIEVPKAKYAVFTTPPVDTSVSNKTYYANQDNFAESIRDTWEYIFKYWFTTSGYNYDFSKLDFEYYDERCHFRKDTVMDIYVPITN